MNLMFNLTIGVTLSDRDINFIPKLYSIKKNKVWFRMIRWLFFELQIDNNALPWHGREMCYQLGYTMLLDSYTKSNELMDIINENEDLVTTLGKVGEYVDATGLCNNEKDENSLHIVVDGFGQNYWEEQKIKNAITQMHFEEEERKLREENQKRNGFND